MKILQQALWINFLCLLMLVSLHSSAQTVADEYRVDSGDIIKVTVFGQQDLSIETLLNDSGKIDYPFLGQLQAAGLTLAELQHQIYQGLKGDYLVNPNVSVSIVEYRPFFIDGEVKDPGGYPFQPGLTVSKAAALAGGYTERASLAKIFIIRSNDPDQKSINVKANVSVNPGDIITVKQSYF
jgi:polysaccharide export outer membrane protein